MNKIFFIGLNKTGTRTLHNTLSYHGINSTHNIKWPDWSNEKLKELFKYTSYLDGHQPDFIWLDKIFPNSTFVLNTRNLKKWLVSRYNHTQRNKINNIPWTDNSRTAIKEWILMRNDYHKKALDYFGDRLIIIDVEKLSDEQLSNKLSIIIKNPVTEIIKDGIDNRDKKYLHEVIRINTILDRMEITESECDELYIKRLIR